MKIIERKTFTLSKQHRGLQNNIAHERENSSHKI